MRYARAHIGDPGPQEREWLEQLAAYARQMRDDAQDALLEVDDPLNPRIAMAGREYDPAELTLLCEQANDAIWDVLSPKDRSG